jgi:hypothetical protein
MAGELGAVAYDIIARDKTASGIKSASQRLKEAGDAAAQVGLKMSMAITLPLAGGAAAATYLASNAAETQAKFEQVFGSLTDDMNAWVDEYGNAVGRARTDLKETTATMMSIVKAMGLGGEEGAELSKTITQLSVDMGAFHNSSDIEAFNALRSAITGEYEPMKRFGVVINEAKVQQELLNMGITGGTKAATDAEKAQARMNIIMRATTDVQGAAAREAGGFASQIKALEADAKELGESIGADLLPAAQRGIEIVRRLIAGLRNLDSGTRGVIIAVGGFAAAIGPVVFIGGKVVSTIAALRTAHTAYTTSAFAATVATRGFSAALLATPAGVVALAIAGVVAGLTALIWHLGRAEEKAFNLGDAMSYSADEMREQAAALREEESVLSKLTRTVAAYSRSSSEYGLEFMMSFGGIRQSIRDTEAEQWEYAATVKDAMDAAQAELRKADQAYSDHQRVVSDLGREYDELKAAIDRAMEMPEDIDDQGRAIEHAEIALARARERQRGLGADATRLDRWEADLAVRDAEDRLDDARKRLSDLEAEQDEILGGRTLEQARARLAELQRQKDEETALMEEALRDRNNLQAYYDGLAQQQAEDMGKGVRDNWLALKKDIEENPIAARVGLDMGWFSSKLAGAGIPALAGGGIVTEPTLALIGEAGPEAVVPLSGGGGSSVSFGGDTLHIGQINVRSEHDLDEIFRRWEEMQRSKRVQRGVRA